MLDFEISLDAPQIWVVHSGNYGEESYFAFVAKTKTVFIQLMLHHGYRYERGTDLWVNDEDSVYYQITKENLLK